MSVIDVANRPYYGPRRRSGRDGDTDREELSSGLGVTPIMMTFSPIRVMFGIDMRLFSPGTVIGAAVGR